MILFCLPYAGGTATVYNQWKKFLEPDIKVFPIELKGRGKRFNETFYQDINEAIEDIYNVIQTEVINDDYAIFGHSMGSLLAYELYYKLEASNIKRPTHMFFSGYRSPDITKELGISHSMPEDEFIKRIIAIGGVPQELMYNKKLLKLFLPALRSDIRLIEEYSYQDRENKLDCGITVFRGTHDLFSAEEMKGWQKQTTSDCVSHTMKGNHFFINNNQDEIITIMKKTLSL